MGNEHAQQGYDGNPVRSRGHDVHKYQAYYGWKECRRLGIEYEPEPLHHSNLYIRTARLEGGEVSFRYAIDQGLIEPVEKAVKYAYPIGMTPKEKQRFRAAARRQRR